MKYLLAILLLTLATSLHAARATVSFKGNNPAGYGEYLVESYVGTTWSEIAKGPASPISFDSPSTPGVYKFRVRHRANGVTTAPSNEATATIGSNAPTEATVVLALATIEVKPDGTFVASVSVPPTK